jgi:predicted nucleic acid-binding protein
MKDDGSECASFSTHRLPRHGALTTRTSGLQILRSTCLKRVALRSPPLQFWFEVRNVVLLGLRRNRLTPDGMVSALARIDSATVAFDPLPESARIVMLARRRRLSFYDAAYLELAQREAVALATLDQALARAAVAEGVPLIGA